MRHFERQPSPIPDHVPCEPCEVEHLGLTLRYLIWGDRTKPLVILQHGGKDHGRSWDWTVAGLVEDYCLAVPDLRGHGDSGRSGGGGYEALDLVSDFALIVEDLAERGFTAPFAIIGHSLGGNIALHYAAACPEKVSSLIAIEGLGLSQKRFDEIMETPSPARWRKAVEKRLSVIGRGGRTFTDPDEGVARMAALHKQLSFEQADHLARHALRQTERGWMWKHDPALSFVAHRPMPPAEYNELYAGIECPVLLMYGADSWATSPKEDGRMDPFKQAELIIYEKAGHWLHHDQTETFLADSKAFLGQMPY